jgi:hypothetical protein
MYLYYCARRTQGGELYLGLSPEFATAGFRIYAESDEEDSAIETLARPRVTARPRYLAQQKLRLGRRYDSYWYSSEKRQWTKNAGWPTKPADWNKLLAWIVRRKMPVTDALRPGFTEKIATIFREVFPLYQFTSFPDSKRRA